MARFSAFQFVDSAPRPSWNRHGAARLDRFRAAPSRPLAAAARPPEGGPEGGAGLGCYLVPDRLPDGAPNRFWMRRLKDKLGTRGLPTGGIDLEDAWALEIAGPGDGLKVMMEALGYGRIHNAVAACGVPRRALLEALCWASHREAFGAAIRSYPSIRDALLDLATEAEAATALAQYRAGGFGRGRGPAARRLLDLMADTLAGALLVEAAVFDLKAGDGRKACIARRFAVSTFGPRAAIGPEPDPDQADFDRLLGDAANEAQTGSPSAIRINRDPLER